MLLILTLILAVIPTDAEAAIYDDTLRLHILARSDSTEDQAVKLKIRDFVLSEWGEDFEAVGNSEDAERMAEELIPDIRRGVNAELEALGADYRCEVTVTKEWYDTREYEDFTLPAGIYSSVRILLGGGEGKNWWCVMYPPLCTEIASERAPADDGAGCYTDEEDRLIRRGKYSYKFKILELFAKAFS